MKNEKWNITIEAYKHNELLYLDDFTAIIEGLGKAQNKISKNCKKRGTPAVELGLPQYITEKSKSKKEKWNITIEESDHNEFLLFGTPAVFEESAEYITEKSKSKKWWNFFKTNI